MSKKSKYIETIEEVLKKYFAAIRIPVSILDKNNKSHFCIPPCEDNSWPEKNNVLCQSYYKFSQIKTPTLIIKDSEFYFGIIPIDYSLYVILGPILPTKFTLSELLQGLSNIYTEKEIVTYYHVNSDAGNMDNIRFSNIFALLSGSLLHQTFYPDQLFFNRIIVDRLPIALRRSTSSPQIKEENSKYLIKLEENSPFSIKCAKYIESHLRERITASDLAEALNISERSLYRLFKQNFTLSLNDFIHHQKMNKSLEMLLTTDMTISEIASYWGYSSQSHFNKTFEKFYKKTPGEYRKEHR